MDQVSYFSRPYFVMRPIICAGIVLFLSSSVLAQTIYKWKNEKGNWHFGQSPPVGVRETERRSLPQSKAPTAIEPNPNEPSCSTFTIGETRQFKEFTPSTDFPHLQVSDFQVRLVDSNKEVSTFSYKLLVRNNSRQRDAVRGTFELLDCSGFSLAEEPIAAHAIAGGEEITITGSKAIFGATGLKVGRFQASFKGAPKRSADVRVYYTQLQNTGSEIYFVGEVTNIGSSTAHNVKVTFMIKDERGSERPKDIVEVSPSDLKPGQTGIFRKRVFFLSDTRGYGWYSEAQWSE